MPPANMPTIDCCNKPIKLWLKLKAFSPTAMENNVIVRITAIASLNADSLITNWDIFAGTLVCLNTGIKVAGSVDAIVDPKSNATIKGRPIKNCAAIADIKVVINTPNVEISKSVGHTFLIIWMRTLAPPSNKM